MQPHGTGGPQKTLPFLEAEISSDERFSYLGLALMRVRADIYLANFVRWIFNVTKGGVEGELEKSYEQLAARPWGLCCSPATARRTAVKAEALGLVKMKQQIYRNGAQRPNLYAINWVGIRYILNLRNALPGEDVTLGHTDQPLGHTDQPLGHTDQALGHTDSTPSQADHRYKEYPSYGPSYGPSKNTGPVRSGAEPDFYDDSPRAENAAEEFSRATQRTQSTADPRMVGRRQSVPGDERFLSEDVLRAVLFEEVPELAEASQRNAKPLPAGEHVYGSTKPAVLTSETIKSGLLLVEWFRRHLGTDDPFCGQTEADLLLVMAAAGHAEKMPQQKVLKNRVAIFCAQVSHRKWRQVLHQVQAARKRLDGMQRVYPDVLTCEAWPPAPVIDFQSRPAAAEEPPAAEKPMTLEQSRAARAEFEAAMRRARETKTGSGSSIR